MDRHLSSRATPFWHYVLPAFWGGSLLSEVLRVAGLALGRPAAGPGVGPPEWAWLAMVVAGAALVAWIAARLRDVRVAGDALVVGRYGRAARVPLVAVREVRQPRVLGVPGAVVVRVTPPVPGVGDQFSFLPPARFWRGWREAREVGELRRLVASRAGASAAAI